MLAEVAFEMPHRHEKRQVADLPCPCCGLWSQKWRLSSGPDWGALPLPLFACRGKGRRLWRFLCPMRGEGCFCFREVVFCCRDASLCFREAVQKGCWGVRG